MSSAIVSLDTSITSMTAIFTPPASCSSHWTYEPQTANSVAGGLLIQDAQYQLNDFDCQPPGFKGWGRAPDFIQVFSPGVCPDGYTTANEGFSDSTTTAVCCPSSDTNPSNFGYTTLLSSVNLGDKTALYFGCTSTFPADAGFTTAFAEVDGFSSSLDGTTTKFTSVSGPVTMWGQPITVAFQQADLAIFSPSATSTSGSTSSSSSSSSSSSTTMSGTAAAASATTTSSSANSSLSGGAIAGIIIGAAAVLGLLIGAALFFRARRHKSAAAAAATTPPMSGPHGAEGTYYAPDKSGYQQPYYDGQQQQQQAFLSDPKYADAPPSQPAELHSEPGHAIAELPNQPGTGGRFELS
nr:hypothetical protein CFP56_37244 [Quercus suber]